MYRSVKNKMETLSSAGSCSNVFKKESIGVGIRVVVRVQAEFSDVGEGLESTESRDSLQF